MSGATDEFPWEDLPDAASSLERSRPIGSVDCAHYMALDSGMSYRLSAGLSQVRLVGDVDCEPWARTRRRESFRKRIARPRDPVPGRELLIRRERWETFSRRRRLLESMERRYLGVFNRRILSNWARWERNERIALNKKVEVSRSRRKS